MATVSVSIAATGDDGAEIVGFAFDPSAPSAGYVSGIAESIAFFRFLAITGPISGATINSATITLNILTITGTPNTTCWGVDVDDAAAFSNPGNLPSAVTKTTASSDGDPAGTGTRTINVVTQVQEIINRGGWASGNDIAFIVDDNAGTGSNYWAAEDYQAAGTAQAVLDIDYTNGPTVKALAGTSGSLSGAISRRANKALSGVSGSNSGTVAKRTNKPLVGVMGALTGTLSSIKLSLVAVAGAMGSLSGSLARSPRKVLAGVNGSLSGSIARQVNKALTGAAGILSATLVRLTKKDTLTGTSGSLSGALTAAKAALVALAGIAGSLSGAVVKKPIKALAGTSGSLSGNIAKQTNKALSGVPGTLTGALSTAVGKFVSLAGTMGSLSASLARSTSKSFAGATDTISGALSRKTVKSFAGTMGSITGTISRSTLKALSGATGTVSGALSRAITKILSGNLVPSGSLATLLNHTASVFYQSIAGAVGTLTGASSSASVIRRAKMKAGTVIRTILGGASRGTRR